MNNPLVIIYSAKIKCLTTSRVLRKNGSLLVEKLLLSDVSEQEFNL